MWGRFLPVLVLVLVPAPLFAYLAGGFWYVRDHRDFERTHVRNTRYSEILNEYERAGGTVGALSGLAILLTLGEREKRKQREALPGQPAEEGDGTVWPPPPHNGS